MKIETKKALKTVLFTLASIASGSLIWTIADRMFNMEEVWDYRVTYYLIIIPVSMFFGYLYKEKFWLWAIGIFIGQYLYIAFGSSYSIEDSNFPLWVAFIFGIFFNLPTILFGTVGGFLVRGFIDKEQVENKKKLYNKIFIATMLLSVIAFFFVASIASRDIYSNNNSSTNDYNEEDRTQEEERRDPHPSVIDIGPMGGEFPLYSREVNRNPCSSGNSKDCSEKITVYNTGKIIINGEERNINSDKIMLLEKSINDTGIRDKVCDSETKSDYSVTYFIHPNTSFHSGCEEEIGGIDNIVDGFFSTVKENNI